ncbi:MAG: hypothetical protein JJU22_08045 [Gammaproteobacteria bacterium]|nr:hypothetical protein [Gammaproteobacteria bacterium]
MGIRKITEDLSVSAQITAEDLATIRKAGFRAIICNRPDGEAADQPSFEEIEAAAKAEGLSTRYLPINTAMAPISTSSTISWPSTGRPARPPSR